jgi:hypothetical protein
MELIAASDCNGWVITSVFSTYCAIMLGVIMLYIAHKESK